MVKRREFLVVITMVMNASLAYSINSNNNPRQHQVASLCKFFRFTSCYSLLSTSAQYTIKLICKDHHPERERPGYFLQLSPRWPSTVVRLIIVVPPSPQQYNNDDVNTASSLATIFGCLKVVAKFRLIKLKTTGMYQQDTISSSSISTVIG